MSNNVRLSHRSLRSGSHRGRPVRELGSDSPGCDEADHAIRVRSANEKSIEPQLVQMRQRLAQCEGNLARVQFAAEHQRHDVGRRLRRRASLHDFGQPLDTLQLLSPAYHGVSLARDAAGTEGATLALSSLGHLAVLLGIAIVGTWSSITMMRRRLVR